MARKNLPIRGDNLSGLLLLDKPQGVTSNGAVTQSGALVIPGTTTITASGSNITLENTTNNFGTIGTTGAVVSIIDSGAVILGASTVSGTYTVETKSSNTRPPLHFLYLHERPRQWKLRGKLRF